MILRTNVNKNAWVRELSRVMDSPRSLNIYLESASGWGWLLCRQNFSLLSWKLTEETPLATIVFCLASHPISPAGAFPWQVPRAPNQLAHEDAEPPFSIQFSVFQSGVRLRRILQIVPLQVFSWELLSFSDLCPRTLGRWMSTPRRE